MFKKDQKETFFPIEVRDVREIGHSTSFNHIQPTPYMGLGYNLVAFDSPLPLQLPPRSQVSLWWLAKNFGKMPCIFFIPSPLQDSHRIWAKKLPKGTVESWEMLEWWVARNGTNQTKIDLVMFFASKAQLLENSFYASVRRCQHKWQCLVQLLNLVHGVQCFSELCGNIFVLHHCRWTNTYILACALALNCSLWPSVPWPRNAFNCTAPLSGRTLWSWEFQIHDVKKDPLDAAAN